MTEYKVLHVASDQIGDFCVLDNGDYRVLSFGDHDEQTKLDKKQPHIPQHTYVQAMLAVLLFLQPKSVIVLGLGGGSLVHALRHYDAAINITAVELRASVIQVSKQYFQLPIGKKLSLVHQDAIEFIYSNEHKKVDIIFADIYTEQGVNQHQLSLPFMEYCRKGLKQDGMLVLNCWKEHSRDNDFLANLKHEFTYVYACLTGGGNWVVFATNKPTAFSMVNNKGALQDLSQQLDFPIGRVLNRFEEWVSC